MTGVQTCALPIFPPQEEGVDDMPEVNPPDDVTVTMDVPVHPLASVIITE